VKRKLISLISSLTLLRVSTQNPCKGLMLLRLLFSYLPTISTEYSTNTPRLLTLWSILKLCGIIIVTGILICTDIPNNLKTGKNSKELLRRQNETSLMEKSMRFPIKIIVLEKSWTGSKRENFWLLKPFNTMVDPALN